MARGLTDEEFKRRARAKLRKLQAVVGGELLPADRKVGLPYRLKLTHAVLTVLRQNASNGETFANLRAFPLLGGYMLATKENESDVEFARRFV